VDPGYAAVQQPETTSGLASGLTLVELARAVVVFSDNTAANVLLHRMGGPEAMTAWWRSIGDHVSRLDRFEPDLNRVPPGSLPDTTTPAAMMLTVEKLVSGRVLQTQDRDLLTGWMAESQTGLRRVRAAVPLGWVTGDKTGTSLSPVNVTYVDLAFAGPVGKEPLIMAIWYEPAAAERELSPAAEAVVAECARIFIAGAAQ
jgi:beta-lactamase class A